MTDVTPLKYQGKKPTSAMLIELWTNAEQRFGGTDGRTDRIKKCQALRRGTEKVEINGAFLNEHPEVSRDTAVSLLPERESYERDLIAKAGSVLPKISREPLDVTETAIDEAEEYEAYEREVAFDREHGVPYQLSIEKLTEDGECGATALPAHLDADGTPDLYDRLSERALAAMKSDRRKAYTKDDHDRRGRYVRRNERGERAYNPKYERDAKGRTRAQAEKANESFEGDRDKTKEAHAAAVRSYLLKHNATSFRIIPALDCYPLLGRGSGQQKWKVEGLIERSLLTREALVEKGYGWAMLSDRLLLPRGVSRSKAMVKDELYLYTAYLMLKAEDDEDGCRYHPCVLYTIGGAGTWWSDGTTPTGEQMKDRADEVAIIDLYEEFKIKEPRWTYEWGTHTSDDDANWYGRPAIWPFRRRILNIENLETAAGVAVQMECYSGHYYKPDAALLAADPQAVVDMATHALRKPKKPGPGAIEPWAGDVVPFAQASIGRDHYALHDTHMESLKENMAVDAIKGDTGHAMLVSASQGQVSKRHIREGSLRLFGFFLEADAMNRLSAWKCHEVEWPILTSKERPVGHEVRSRLTPVEFKASWLGEDENPKLNVTYGEEFNVARAGMEMDAADRGYRALKHVAAAFGEDDEMNLRFEIAKDAMWKLPENQLLLQSMVDARRQMTRQRKAMLLQAQERQTQQGMTGAPNGAPMSMFKRAAGQQMSAMGQQAAGGSAGSTAGNVIGGINSAEAQGARMQLQAQASAGAA